MTSKSNEGGSLINLPKGGGALSGLGEKFAPDLHTGTGNYSIPLTLPAGRNGFTPKLALSYSTGQGQGPFGLGWTLGLPGVSRKTSAGVPRYRDASPLADDADVFVLSGSEDLVAIEVSDDGTRTRYRPRTEGTFAWIERHRDPARRADYWEVRTKDGITSFYGTNPSDAPRSPGPHPDVLGRDPAITSAPGAPDHIFAWSLTLTRDRFGNRIEYLYDRDRSTAGDERDGHRWDVPVLTAIRYADHGDRAAPSFLVTVELAYEDRPDPYSDGRAGFEVRRTQRCRAITVITVVGERRAVKEYRLRYRSDGHTRASLLEAVEAFGFDDAGTAVRSLPPLELAYTSFEPELRDRRAFSAVRGAELPAVSLASPNLALVDLHGQGLPDLFELGDTARYWRNLGDGRFDLPRAMTETPAGLSLAGPGVQLLDADGDGRMDLVVSRDAIAGFFPLRFGPRWDRRSFRRWDAAPTIDLRDPEVRLLDLTGDGVTDALRTGARLECYFNDPVRGWHATRRIERRGAAEFPDVQFSDPRVLTADMTGDGLTDIVLVHDGSLCYWPSHGYGEFGPRIQMRNAPRLPFGYDPKRLLIGDVNGDGLADLVYVEHRRVTLWINQSGNAWSEPIAIEGTPAVTSADAIRLVDLLGSGVAGVLWTSDLVERGRPHYFFLDLTGGAKPYLLARTRNNLGAETRVEYRPSTQAYLDDCRPGATPWQTTLPFPVQTVARVETVDALSGGRLVTRYSYHHGYWDGREREFRGFGRVDQLDAETFTGGDRAVSPPTLLRTWFHQGAVDGDDGAWRELDYRPEQWTGPGRDPLALADLLAGAGAPGSRDAARSLRGSVLRSELYALDGDARQDRPYTVTEGCFGVREEAPPPTGRPGRRRIFFPHARAERTTQWERGDDPMTQVSFTHGHDELGRPIAQTQIACPRGWRALDHRPSAAYLATRSRTVYAAPASPAVYLHDRVARADSFELAATAGCTVAELVALADDAPSLRRIGQHLTFYDGPAFTGLPLGTLGEYGAASRSEALVLTPEVLTAAYGAAVPPYLSTGAWTWPPEYPQAFRDGLAAAAGYAHHDGSEPGIAEGLFAIDQRTEHDFQRDPGTARGLVLRTRDPLGNDTQITYDFELLPASVTDAAGMVTRAEYHPRFLVPRSVSDANGNRRELDYLPSGLVSAAWLRGASPDQGDRARPSAQYRYDLLAFVERGAPVCAATIRFVHHDTEAGVPIAERDLAIESREYSDGFGRILQTRAQGEDLRFGDPQFGGGVLPADLADPGSAPVIATPATQDRPNVVVSGAQIYDNKGRVVETFEPYFAEGWDFAPARAEQHGQSTRMTYDPRGHAIRTVNPDGSETLVVQGVPVDLAVPSSYAPTPWEAYTYDANDNAGRTHASSSGAYLHCRDTPASIEVDALGRTVRSIARNRTVDASGSLGPVEEHATAFTHDVRGNVLSIVDPLHRVAFANRYDLANRPLHAWSLDAGDRWMAVGPSGLAVETRDAKGALQLHRHDALGRSVRLWARDAASEPVTLRATTLYGDELPPDAEAARRNLLGKPHVACDGAGRTTFVAYDFAGNLVDKTREVIADAAIAAQVDAGAALAHGFRVDWDDPPALDGADATSLAYDALGRVTRTVLPADVTGARKTMAAHYNRAGALEGIELDGEVYVRHIAYDAKGQRVLVAYGNDYLTRHAYDPQTLRLVRTRTESYAPAAGPVTGYAPEGGVLQDFGYAHDLVGNVLAIRDRAPGSGIRNTPLGKHALDRVFAYDALSRLTRATGRESIYVWPPAGGSGKRARWDRSPWAQGTAFQPPGNATPDAAPDQTRAYTETYAYDPAGNLVELHHASTGGAWTRHFGMGGLDPSAWDAAWRAHATSPEPWQDPPGNRLTHLGDDQPAAPRTHTYDACGNLVRENGSRNFAWSAADQLVAFVVRTKVLTAPPSVVSCYLYDGAGQRAKKWTRVQSGAVETTVYLDGGFERGASGGIVNNTIHVLDGHSRIAMLRVGPAFPDEGAPELAIKYHLGDHLGSSHVVVGVDPGAGNVLVNREEFYPYGETSHGGFTRKRYRFTGMERDEDSGLSYHSARYYAPWLARWTSCDPLARRELPSSMNTSEHNSYAYSRGAPLTLVDVSGEQSASPEDSDSLTRNTYERHKDSNSGPAGSATAGGVARGGETAVEEGFFASIVSGKTEPSFGKSLIPVVGSVQSANYHFHRENWVRGVLWSLVAISDVFLVGSIFKGVGKVLVRGGAAFAASEFAQGLRLAFSRPSWRTFGETGRLLTGRAQYTLKDLVWNPKVFEKVSKQYWRGTANKLGMQLQHLWAMHSTKWVPLGLRNSGLNLLEVPARFNHWMGAGVSNQVFRLGIGTAVKADLMASYEMTKSALGLHDISCPPPEHTQ